MSPGDDTGFFSYAREDFDDPDGRLQRLHEDLERGIRLKRGRPFTIFRDKRDIPVGDKWLERIANSIAECSLFISVFSPSFFHSPWCLREFHMLLERTTADSSLPHYAIRWQDFEHLKDEFEHTEMFTHAEMVDHAMSIQLMDLDELRLKDKATDDRWRRRVDDLARRIEKELRDRAKGRRVLQPRLTVDSQGRHPIPVVVPILEPRFRFGSPLDEADRDDYEFPAETRLSRSVEIGEFCVTFDEYDAFRASPERRRPNDFGWGRGGRPVVDVSWDDAAAYCKWLSEMTGERYRLPMENEWECACRAGTTTRYAFGDEITVAQANHFDHVGRTTPAGRYPPNHWGIYDMHGNVQEWTLDRWTDPRIGAGDISADALSPRVIRGGWFSSDAPELRSAFRNRAWQGKRAYNIGFRVARDKRTRTEPSGNSRTG